MHLHRSGTVPLSSTSASLIPQETKLGDEDKVRELYERAVTLNLSTKKMKFMLKRYLKFEQEHGNEERVEKIKEKAMAYVMSKQ